MTQTSKLARRSLLIAMMVVVSTALTACNNRHVVGSVNTEFKLIGPDHKIVIES